MLLIYFTQEKHQGQKYHSKRSWHVGEDVSDIYPSSVIDLQASDDELTLIQYEYPSLVAKTARVQSFYGYEAQRIFSNVIRALAYVVK